MEARLIEFLYHFNVKRDYFECHEVLESLWLDSGRPVILKGLIQTAVSLYHLENGNIRGGFKMWQRAKQYMADERPVYQSIQLELLIREVDQVFARVPNRWYDKIVAPEVIAGLPIQKVTIQITNPEFEHAVSSGQFERKP